MLRAADRLDKDRFRDALAISIESQATFINFQSYKRSVQFLKAQPSKLSPDTEALYKGRLEQVLTVYRRSIGAAEDISMLFSSSGFGDALIPHVKTLFDPAPSNSLIDRSSRFLRGIGSTDDELRHYVAWLRANDSNPFRLGTDGKFSGLVQSFTKRITCNRKGVGSR